MERPSQPLDVDEIPNLVSHSHRRAPLCTLQNHDDNLITFDEALDTLEQEL